MRQSRLFTKTRREAPKDEVSKNASLLIRAGFINKEMAGVYDYLPLGLRVLRNIENIIRSEMNAIGGQEVLLTTLQDPSLWEKTDRWSDKNVDNWFKSKLANGTDIGIANTHEEPMTQMLKHFASSHKEFPIYTYQFQTKFRNELRAKSGMMRAREFLMKDLYSFSRTEDEFKDFYEECAAAYLRIFERVGLKDVTFRTVAAGGSFTKGFTDEFQAVSDAGEDIIYIDDAKKLAVNKEVLNDETLAQFGLDKKNLREAKSIEIGNIFPLGTRYSEALGLTVKGEDGTETPAIMGSYGIGLGRLMGTIVEVCSDDAGIVWPESVAPFQVHLIPLVGKDLVPMQRAEELYRRLEHVGVTVLFDDRELRPGEKFGDADLIGIPWRLVISEKTLASESVECKNRKTGEVVLLPFDKIIEYVGKTKEQRQS